MGQRPGRQDLLICFVCWNLGTLHSPTSLCFCLSLFSWKPLWLDSGLLKPAKSSKTPQDYKPPTSQYHRGRSEARRVVSQHHSAGRMENHLVSCKLMGNSRKSHSAFQRLPLDPPQSASPFLITCINKFMAVLREGAHYVIRLSLMV